MSKDKFIFSKKELRQLLSESTSRTGSFNRCGKVYDWLKSNPNHSEEFCNSYKDCYFLDELEGKVFEGTWSGYKVTPLESDKSYYTDEGIRGTCGGLFVVIDGELRQVSKLAINQK